MEVLLAIVISVLFAFALRKQIKRYAVSFYICLLYTSIAPPSMLPLWSFTRYFTAANVSEYFVAMPNTPVSHIHSTAPGPPARMAVPTPTMLSLIHISGAGSMTMEQGYVQVYTGDGKGKTCLLYTSRCV